MSQIDDWLGEQSRREGRIVRLEDALLAGRYGSYFFFRLRYFMARTAVAALLHGVRILLLLTAFGVDEFLFVILVTASTSLVGDVWWGALEAMRSRIRHLQRVRSGFRAPDEIASWLRLAIGLAAMGSAGAVVLLVIGMLVEGGLTPILVMVIAMVVGASVNIVVRAYHSGAYAVRRVYRPLPSLLAADLVSLAGLLILWPVIGLWAFPLAEALTIAILVGLSIRYTTRTYRSLAYPTLVPLLRRHARLPGRAALRSALAPAASFGLVGLEGLVLLAVLLADDGESTAVLVALLAALTPVLRAGFEWARLLYFDLARLEVLVLAGLRRRFDRMVAGLAVVIGAMTWLVAALVALVILGVRDAALIAALLPFLVARSVGAAVQMRAFTARAYVALGSTGLLATAGFLVAFAVLDDAAARVIGLTLAMTAAAAALVIVPIRTSGGAALAAPTDWLERLRETTGPVTVYRVGFDRRDMARWVPSDARRQAAWRRQQVGRRFARVVARAGGSTTWLDPHELAWYLPGHVDLATSDARPRLVEGFGGLAVSRPSRAELGDGASAAFAVLGSDADHAILDVRELIDVFRRQFPSGIVVDIEAPDPVPLRHFASRDRGTILREAVRSASGQPSSRAASGPDVTAAVVSGRLRALFLLERQIDGRERRSWRSTVERSNRGRAALGVTAGA